jgi:hypothetical protein
MVARHALVEEVDVLCLLLVDRLCVHLDRPREVVVEQDLGGADARRVVSRRVDELVDLVERERGERLVVELDAAVGLHRDRADRVELGVLLADPLARGRLDTQLLPLAHLHEYDPAELIRRAIRVDGDHVGVLRDKVL